MEIIKNFFKVIKISYLLIIFSLAGLALYTKVSGNNIVDNFVAGNKFERIERLSLPQKVLNKVDQTIETELGRLKITDIKILNGVSYHPDGSRQEAFVITYEFTPKKSGIKTNTLFDETVIVTQNDKNPQPAVFFGGGVDQSVIDSVNESVGIISEEEVGKPKTASSAYAVDPGRVDVLFGNKKTLYWVNKKE